MKRLAIVTGSRAEWGVLKSFAALAVKSKAFHTDIIAAGMHLMEQYGYTYRGIEADGFDMAAMVPMHAPPIEGLQDGIRGFADAFDQLHPDLVLLEGDRVEPLAAALAAGYMGIPIAHAGGGDVTTTIDNSARHAISAFASLHLATHEAAADRLRALDVHGEIHVTGALGIDAIRETEFPPREAVLSDLGLPADSRYLLVAFHPETGHEGEAGIWMENLLRACCSTGLNLAVTYPNSDPGSECIIEQIHRWVSPPGDGYVTIMRAFPNLGTRYLPALRYADALVGNSSSGLYEAPSLKVPVVNVGYRQHGRATAANVAWSDYDYEAITYALRKVLSPEWRARTEQAVSPFGDGHAAERMMEIIERKI